MTTDIDYDDLAEADSDVFRTAVWLMAANLGLWIALLAVMVSTGRC